MQPATYSDQPVSHVDTVTIPSDEHEKLKARITELESKIKNLARNADNAAILKAKCEKLEGDNHKLKRELSTYQNCKTEDILKHFLNFGYSLSQKSDLSDAVEKLTRADFDLLTEIYQKLKVIVDETPRATIPVDQVAKMGVVIADLIDFTLPYKDKNGFVVFDSADVFDFIKIYKEEKDITLGIDYPIFDFSFKQFLHRFAQKVDGTPARLALLLSALVNLPRNNFSYLYSISGSDYHIIKDFFNLQDENVSETATGVDVVFSVPMISALAAKFCKTVLKKFKAFAADLKSQFLAECDAIQISNLTDDFHRKINPVFYDPETNLNFYNVIDVELYNPDYFKVDDKND